MHAALTGVNKAEKAWPRDWVWDARFGKLFWKTLSLNELPGFCCSSSASLPPSPGPVRDPSRYSGHVLLVLAIRTDLLFAELALEDGPEAAGVTHAAVEGHHVRVRLERPVAMVTRRHLTGCGGRGERVYRQGQCGGAWGLDVTDVGFVRRNGQNKLADCPCVGGWSLQRSRCRLSEYPSVSTPILGQ